MSTRYRIVSMVQSSVYRVLIVYTAHSNAGISLQIIQPQTRSAQGEIGTGSKGQRARSFVAEQYHQAISVFVDLNISIFYLLYYLCCAR